MGNGQMLNELRKLAESKGELSHEAALRLTLSALANIYDTTQKFIDLQEERYKNMERCDNEIAHSIDCLSTQITELKQANEKILKNPAIGFGNFITDKPKLSAFLGFAFFVLINLWFLPGFRHLILLWLNVPKEVIDILVPTIVP